MDLLKVQSLEDDQWSRASGIFEYRYSKMCKGTDALVVKNLNSNAYNFSGFIAYASGLQSIATIQVSVYRIPRLNYEISL
jgi:hypothetical protein